VLAVERVAPGWMPVGGERHRHVEAPVDAETAEARGGTAVNAAASGAVDGAQSVGEDADHFGDAQGRDECDQSENDPRERHVHGLPGPAERARMGYGMSAGAAPNQEGTRGAPGGFHR